MQGTEMTTRETEALAGKLLRAVDLHNDMGDRDRALLLSDAADALLALLDFDATVTCAL